ncbi:PilZ domain-containing protein [Desulfovibrio mangrovi]|uniref:PilZ domain-containing protein n=1 Tax=Desulfovibrio mangrovi TaxID=2976983 RepID=UPI0022471111|nr:PilZ domain-containing protein [Desulfovibrio mangrovi]UZP65865.1 PilZ domain-containing protein [Desulfovibrio mangrovi]
MTQILVIARDNENGDILKRRLEQLGASPILASESDAIVHVMRTVPLQGILINMPTFLRLHGEGKNILNESMDSFPLLRCRLDSESGALTVFEQGQNPDQALTLFVRQCTEAKKRTIRREERTVITCAVLLSQDASFNPATTERTITFNVSTLGAFCFSTHAWKPGQPAWLQFLDLNDKTPISGSVAHATRWGKGCRQPGCGISFNPITDAQREELAALLKGNGVKVRQLVTT